MKLSASHPPGLHSTLWKYSVAASVILVVIGALVLMYTSRWTYMGATLGPTRIATTPDGGWWAASHDHLHRFDAEGYRLAKVPLERAGIDDPAAGLGVLEDGRVLLSQANDPALLLCDSDAGNCAALQLEHQGKPLALESVALLQGTTGDRFVVSDSDGRRILLAGTDGRVMAMRILSEDAADSYRVPYQPRLAPDGQVLLPDRRQRLIRVLAANTLEETASFPVAQGTTSARVLPVESAQAADGRRWVLNAKACLCEGEIVEFDSRAAPTRVVDMGIGDPRTLALAGKRLLVASQKDARLDAYDVDAGSWKPVPDAGFRGELQNLRKLRSRGNPALVPGIVAMTAAPLMGVLILYLLGERFPVPVRPMAMQAAAPARIEGGITWIPVTTAFAGQLRRSRFVTYVFSAVVVVLIVGWFTRSSWDGEQSPGLAPSLFSLWLLVFFGAMIAWGWRMEGRLMKRRLGTDGSHFHYDPGTGKLESVLLAELVTDGTTLLAGKRAIVLHDHRRDHFDRETVASLILARLPAGALVSRRRMAWEQVKREPLKWTLIALAGVAMFVLTMLGKL